MTTLLEQYPAIANPLPVAWDGEPVEWGDWQAAQVFICRGSRARMHAHGCRECDYDGGAHLSVRGAAGDGDLPLRLSRCPNCALDMVVDWDQAVWTLGEDDYGPDGSWFQLEEQ